MPRRDTAGGIVLNPEGRIVLVNQGSNVWSFPKGGVEEGERALDAARREVKEETGLTNLTYVSELGTYRRYRIGKGGIGEDIAAGEMSRTIFLFTTDESELGFDKKEILDARWVTIDEALTMLTHPKDAEFLRSVRSKIEQA